MTKQCSECHWWVSIDTYEGTCRVNPPIYRGEELSTGFPLTEAEEWCSAYKTRGIR